MAHITITEELAQKKQAIEEENRDKWTKRCASLRTADGAAGFVEGGLFSWEGQLWVRSLGAAQAMAADCLTDEEWAEVRKEAKEQVLESLTACGMAVITDIDFAKELEAEGFHYIPCGDFTEDGDEFNWIELFATLEDEEKFFENCDRSVLKADESPIGVTFEDDYVEEAYVEEDDGSYSYPLLDEAVVEQDDEGFGDADIVYQFVRALKTHWYNPYCAWESAFGDEQQRMHQDSLTPVEKFCEEMVKLRAKDIEKENSFCGKFVKGFYDRKKGVGYFSTMKDERTVDYMLSHDRWMSICVDIEENKYDYTIQEFSFCDDGRGYLYHRLDEMPFDRYDSEIGFIHATGEEYLEVNGDWVGEYEDDYESNELVKFITFAE